jgi:hypothetical protein
MTIPSCNNCPEEGRSKEIGSSRLEDEEAVSLCFGVIPTSLTKEVATMKKISRIKTRSIKGDTLISVRSGSGDNLLLML